MSEEEVRLFLRELGGQLCISLYGSDAAGNLDSLRTNPSQQLQVEVVGGSWVWVAPALIAAAGVALYTCPANTKAEATVEVMCNGAAVSSITLYRVPNGGAPALSNMIVNAWVVGVNTLPIQFGPYILQAGAFIHAVSLVNNALTGHVHVKEVAA